MHPLGHRFAGSRQVTWRAANPVAVPVLVLAITLTGAGWLPAEPVRHEVLVESLCREPAQCATLHSYLIRASRPTFDERSLRHREAVAHLRTALSALGLFEAPEGVHPDLVIEFDYGLGNPRTVYVEVLQPVYEVQGDGGSVSRQTTRMPGDARRAWLVGYTRVKRPVLVRDKYLAVTARANVAAGGEARPTPELWRVSARIEDNSDELRGYLPVLAALVMDRAGETSPGNEKVVVADNSDAVDFIRRGL